MSALKPLYVVRAERVAAGGGDALAVQRVACLHGATEAQARALARRLCGYEVRP